jgi:hypothetical protein
VRDRRDDRSSEYSGYLVRPIRPVRGRREDHVDAGVRERLAPHARLLDASHRRMAHEDGDVEITHRVTTTSIEHEVRRRRRRAADESVTERRECRRHLERVRRCEHGLPTRREGLQVTGGVDHRPVAASRGQAQQSWDRRPTAQGRDVTPLRVRLDENGAAIDIEHRGKR